MYGFSEKQLKEIIQIFSSYKEIDEAILFGSRAKGTHKEASDVDIAIKGKNITYSFAAKLKSHLEDDTNLPYFFDIIAYKTITSKELKEHIRIYGKTIISGSKNIPKGWLETTLGEQRLDVLNGYAFKAKDFVSLKINNSYLPVLKIKNVANGDANHNDVVFHLVGKKAEKYIIKTNDILIALTGNHPCSKTQIVGGISKYRLKVDSLLNQRVAKLRAKNTEMLCNDFIYYFFKWNETQFYIGNQSSGSANQANISKNDILNIPILLPKNIEEQKQIAKILTSFDDKIDLLQAQNKTLEDIGQTIFKEWFGKYQVGDELPEGWRVGKVRDFLNIFSGFAFKGKSFVPNGKFGLVTIKNVQDGFFIEKTKDRLHIAPQNMPDYCNLNTGDILLSLTGNVGRICHVIGKNYFLNQRVAKIEAKNKKDFSFVYLFFRQKNIHNLLENIASGTAQQNLSPIKTKELEMVIPNREILDCFAKITNPNIEKIFSNQSQIQTLAKTRDTLLPKLMSGEVRVNNFKIDYYEN